MSSIATTNETSNVTSLPSTSKAQTAKEVIAANVKLLIEQLEAGHSEGLTAYLTAMGIEKRVARFPQFYSRIGFVHEFRPLDASQVQELLEKRWTPAGVVLPNEQLVPEVIASLIRMSGGNFRLLTRLLTQIERVLSVNDLHVISTAVVEVARDSLVIGLG